MRRVFLDANVLFSGSNPESAFLDLVQLIFEKSHPVTSDFALEEARRNIMTKRPQWKSTFDTLIDPVEIVPSVTFSLPVELGRKDVPILCTAVRHDCSYLVTGDKRDFGHLFGKSVLGVTILSPVAMVDELSKR